MGGWKTWCAAILIGASGILEALKYAGVCPPEIADAVATFLTAIGAAFGVVGLGHKLEKAAK